jgi:hypothetical protein
LNFDVDTFLNFSIIIGFMVTFLYPLIILSYATNFELPSMAFSYPALVLVELCFLLHFFLIIVGVPPTFISVLLIAACSYQMIKSQYFRVTKETNEKYRKKSVMKWTGWANVVLLVLSVVIYFVF